MEHNKLYFDCTFTFHTGLNTGIQRVVRNIVSRHEVFMTLYSTPSTPVVFFAGYYFELGTKYVLNPKPTTAIVGGKAKYGLNQFKQFIQKFAKRSKFCRDAIDLVFGIVVRVLAKGFWFLKTARLVSAIVGSGLRRVDFQPGGHLVLIDAFWTYDLERGLINTKLPPASISALIYDLIPLRYPQFVERVNQVSFVKALPILRRRVGNFVCISKFVADDLESYFAEYSEEPKKKITHFLLGSDFRISDRKHLDPVREEIAAIFSGVSVWLAVGTIEPRKNHGFILDAFDEIWSSGRLDRLLIIGRVGWMCEDVIERILGHREFNKKLFFKNDIVDHELRYAYEAAKGLIFASPIEGFGLPIVEAMAANIRVFCSDIPVFREVGGDYPSYFSLDEASNLTRLIGAAPVERPPSHSAEANIVNWDTSVAEFAAKVLHIDNR